MKITFFRNGHSNNSSSSHSLIFTRGSLPHSNESNDFGWQYFTCSSRCDKLNYLMSCLNRQFMSKVKRPYLYDFAGYGSKINETVKLVNNIITDGLDKLFKEWVKVYLGFEEFKVGYVDHQSEIYFPFNRDGGRINHEFAKDFIEEFINKNWYVVGGNDNDDNDNLDNVNDDKSDFEDFRILWSFLTDSGDIICVKDSLTQEYVFSNISGNKYKGSILKIKF